MKIFPSLGRQKRYCVFSRQNRTFLFCLVSILTLLGTAPYANAQPGAITVEFSDIPLEEAFKVIEKKTDYVFFYNNSKVNTRKKVSADVKNGTIAQVLTQIIPEYKYRIETYKVIILGLHAQEASAGGSKPEQGFEISGTVTGVNQEAIVGVNIVEKGTTNGTITNTKGHFTIRVAPSATLVASYVGFKSQEITVTNRTHYDITLVEDATLLDNVVVVGFATQKKLNLTGAVGVATAEDIKERPVVRVSQMLQGVVPGLNISQTQGGSLGDSPSINIRGTGTIGTGSTGNPLVLIDGMEGDINTLNPQDVESISVLKDASASSIYGSRAPFGVILITTKSGRKGRVSINYNNNLRWNSPINMPEMMDSYTFATYFNDANIGGGSGPWFSDERMQRILDYQNGVITDNCQPGSDPTKYDGYNGGNDNIDWYKALYRDYAFSHEHNLSITGGNDITQYYISGNYLTQNGLMRFNQDVLDRYAATLKFKSQLTRWMNLNVSTRFIRETYEKPTNLYDNFYVILARQGWPVIPLYDPNGHLYSSVAIGIRDGGRTKNQNDWLYQQVQLVLEPVKDWKIYGEANYRIRNNLMNENRLTTYKYNIYEETYVDNSENYVKEYAYQQNYFNANVYTDYEKSFGKHHLKAMIGMQAELTRYRDLSAKRLGVISSSYPVLDLTSGTDAVGTPQSPEVSGQYQNWSTVGFFGRINYDYDNKYLLEINLRRDGSSRFRGKERWGWFPSASVGWNLSREKFWKPLERVVSTFKIRASYGELGNQNTSNWYPTYSTISYTSSGGSWLVNGNKPNISSAPGLVSETLTWERIKSANIGLDAGFFDNKLTVSFDFFNRKTLDMVGPAPERPVILGTAVPSMNNTDLQTWGFELDVAWRGRLQNGLGYNVRLLLSDAQTQITRYPNQTGTLSTYRPGQMMGEIWGYETIGIAKSKAEMDAHLASLPNGGQSALGTNWDAGDIMYRDLNGDGKIGQGSNTVTDHGDLRIIGNSTPRFPFSIDLGADWKGFDLRIFLQGIMKRDFSPHGSYYFWGAYSWGIWWSTGFKEHEDYFRDDPNHYLGENLDAYYPRPLFSSKNQRPQSRYVQDASYVRLKNIQLGYTIPKRLTRKCNIEQLRIYVSCENLATWTKMSPIFDPETISGGPSSSDICGGSVYPLSKVFSMGISMNF